MSKRNHPCPMPEEPGHGFWISVSDLMAGLIFIFLIIIIVFSIQFKKEQDAFIAAKAELQSPAMTRQKILTDLQEILKKEGLEVEILPAEGILRLSEETLSFPPAKAAPDRKKLANLGILAKALTSVIPCNSELKYKKFRTKGRPAWCQPHTPKFSYECSEQFNASIETVMIEGHTDATTIRASAGYRDNLALSAARATTVLRLLKLCDPLLGQLFNKKKQPLLAASGYSYLRPIIKNDPTDKRNRRIDLRLVMDLPDNALDAELSYDASKDKAAATGTAL